MKGKSTTIRGAYTGGGDSAGVKDGLSKRSDLDTESLHDLSVQNENNRSSVYARQNIEPRGSKSVKEKGHTFDMC